MSHSDSEDSFKSIPDSDNWKIPKSFSQSAKTGNDNPKPTTDTKPLSQAKTAPKSQPAAPADPPASSAEVYSSIPRFPPEEEATLVAESTALKTRGNELFGAGSYDNAIQTYDRALAACPNYLDFELAVLHSNIAACHLQLAAWKAAVDSAGKGLAALDPLEPLPAPPTQKSATIATDGSDDTAAGGAVEELDDAAAERIARLEASGRTLAEVRKLQVKLLLRRARARGELGGWATLQGAAEDYRVLLLPEMGGFLTAADRRAAGERARGLTPRLNAAKESEMAEMMDKLKGLGNSILKPFGLSTNNFQFVKDEKSGGYSMNFEQNPGKTG